MERFPVEGVHQASVLHALPAHLHCFTKAICEDLSGRNILQSACLCCVVLYNSLQFTECDKNFSSYFFLIFTTQRKIKKNRQVYIYINPRPSSKRTCDKAKKLEDTDKQHETQTHKQQRNRNREGLQIYCKTTKEKEQQQLKSQSKLVFLSETIPPF